jgi:hypothetical protein
MKQKTTGKDLSDIGTQQLHKKHDVAVEKLDSGLARAKVRDQLVIDRLLFDDVINIGQHAEAERLLNLAQKAGCFLRSIDMGAVMGGDGRGDLANSGFVRWRYAINGIRRAHGLDGVAVVHECIVENRMPKTEKRIELLVRILDRE